MLTSFFGKSKPVNFIMVSIYMIIGYFFWSLYFLNNTNSFPFFQKQTLLLLIGLFTIFLLNFIVKKNSLTENNTYSIFFLASFMVLMPEFFFNTEIIISNLFLLFAFRRILSMSSEKNMEKKVLDASIWISIASLFYFWCILFFVVLFIAIFQSRLKNYKLIFIPFVGFIAVLILITTVKLLFNGSVLWFLDTDTNLSLAFQAYNSTSLIITILFFSILLIWTLIHKIINFSEIRLKDKANFVLLVVIVLISIIIILFIPNKKGAEFLYLMFPLAIFTTNIIEKLSLFWVKESLLWIALLLPILVVFL